MGSSRFDMIEFHQNPAKVADTVPVGIVKRLGIYFIKYSRPDPFGYHHAHSGSILKAIDLPSTPMR